MTRIIGVAAFAAVISFGVPAMAQTGGSQTGHGMPGMDMQTMMNQCMQMRQQMKPGMRMSPDMQAMMKQCGDMDKQMGTGSSTSDAPRTRTR